MKKQRHLVRVAVYLILKKDDTLLLVRRFQTGFEDGKYSLPAGHVEAGETATEALIRETKEEIGITLQKDDLEMQHVLHRFKEGEDVEYIDFFFSSDTWQGNIENMEPHKCDDLGWFELSNLPENVIPYIQHVLQCVEQNIPFSEMRNS